MARGVEILSGVLSRIDTGWLFLCAGLGILMATLLLPAHDDLAHARLERDRARAIETRAADRLNRHSDYLDALRRGDEAVVLSLAATQLNLAPEGRRPLVWTDALHEAPLFDANILRVLEPGPTVLPELRLPDTTLRRLTTQNRSRLWLLAGGAFCVLIGLLPPARREAAPATM